MKCYAIGGRVNFNYDTVSFCHGMDIGDKIIWRWDSGETFGVEYYLQKVGEFNQKNEAEPRECAGCSNLRQGDQNNGLIEIVTINPNWFCQNRCVYCGNFQGEREELYNPLPIIKEFIEAGLIADNCLFDWGGGEPTVSDCFEEVFLYLLKNKYMQRVNTNAIKLSELLLRNLDSDLVSLRISLDAGNCNTFLYTKGRNLFEQVIRNVGEYSSRTRNIVVKYVITCTNSTEKSIRDFIGVVQKLGIKTICIDTEMMSFGNIHYDGLLRFSEEEINAANLLRRLGHEYNLNVQIGYVWTAQNNEIPSRDYNRIEKISELNLSNEKYPILMDLLPSHEEHNRLYSAGIVPMVMASWETLLHEIKGKKLYIYGAGRNGQVLMDALEQVGISEYQIVDKQLAGKVLGDKIIMSVDEMIERCEENTRVIITPACANEIIEEFNENHFTSLIGKILVMDSYRYSKCAISSLELCKQLERCNA